MEGKRKPKALIDAEKRIKELEEKLKYAESVKDSYSRQVTGLNTTVEGLHDVLDDLGIRRYKDENNRYQSIPLSVRLFAWAMSLAANKKE